MEVHYNFSSIPKIRSINKLSLPAGSDSFWTNKRRIARTVKGLSNRFNAIFSRCVRDAPFKIAAALSLLEERRFFGRRHAGNLTTDAHNGAMGKLIRHV